jgi:DNA-binding response OmpR family regulator
LLSPTGTIAVFAPDKALRQSLTFALEVEGFCVAAYERWKKGSLASWHCVVIDDHIVRNSEEACKYAADPSNRVIMLADGLSPVADDNSAQILTKPFDGAELLRLVKNMAVVD